MQMTRHINPWHINLYVVTVLGYLFWFIVGFPWVNHNESFAWIQQLELLSFSDMLTTIMYPQPTLRPLTQIVAYIAYHIFPQNLYADQIFNFIAAITAWMFLLKISPQKSAFAAVALAVGGFFFSGYIYMFHIHGICYSPILIYIGCLFYFREHHNEPWQIYVLYLITLLAALFHTYAFALYIGFISGLVLKNFKKINLTTLSKYMVFMTLSVMLSKMSLSGYEAPKDLVQLGSLSEMLTSYKMVEVNPAVKVVSVILTLMSLYSIKCSLKIKRIATMIALIIGTLLWMWEMPIVVMWICICIIKAATESEWSIVAIALISLAFPLTRHGSPTHSIFIIMICSAISALNSQLEKRISFMQSNWMTLPIGMIIACAFLLRADVHLPILSNLVLPLKAEQEKTFQLDEIIKWIAASKYSDYYIEFTSPAAIPKIAADAIDRKHRPPTQEEYINSYMSYLRSGSRLPVDPILSRSQDRILLTFGNERIKEKTAIYTVSGRFAGNATVYIDKEQ